MPDPLNVIVVDDEPKVLRLLEQILTAQDCTVRTAPDGLEALKYFKEQPAEVVVTDLKMPKLDGFELIRELKRLDPFLNIIVITAYPSIEGAVESMRYGACDFIIKPFEIAQVHSVLYRARQKLTLGRQLRQGGEGSVKIGELNRRLSEANELKSQFLAGLSQGVNAPLCLMSESIYLLSERTLGKLSPEQEHSVDALIRAYEQLYRLLQQLIDLMQADTLNLHRQLVTLQDLVRQAIGEVMPKATTRSMTISCELPEAAIPLDIDWVRCSHALEYLLDNAIQYNHDHGRIDVTVTLTDQSVEIQIKDTGMGIAPDACERALLPFVRLAPELGSGDGSAGVGLALAKQYARLHGGSLSLSSELGKGTTVVFSLPRPTTTHPPQEEARIAKP